MYYVFCVFLVIAYIVYTIYLLYKCKQIRIAIKEKRADPLVLLEECEKVKEE